jgi:hypothetical protein
MDKEGKPPSTSRAKSFRIGRNSRGNWVVQDQRSAPTGSMSRPHRQSKETPNASPSGVEA